MSKTLFETRPDNKKNFGYGKMTKECDEKGNNAFTTMAYMKNAKVMTFSFTLTCSKPIYKTIPCNLLQI